MVLCVVAEITSPVTECGNQKDTQLANISKMQALNLKIPDTFSNIRITDIIQSAL